MRRRYMWEPLAGHGVYMQRKATHNPEQHWAPVVQADPVPKHVAASTAVGATILVTSGKATARRGAAPKVSVIDTLVIPPDKPDTLIVGVRPSHYPRS